MMRRWRSILDPEMADRLRPPTAGEAAAMWFLGSAWLLYGAWLAVMGLPVWLPAVPVAGLLAMWGWKRRGWLFWFPAAAVVAALLDARLEGVGPGHLLDLVMTGMALVVIARRMAHGWPRRHLGAVEWLKLASLGAGLLLALGDPRGEYPRLWRLAAAGTAAFCAAWLAARRAPASTRARLAFPLASALLGAASLAAGLTRHAPASHLTGLGVLLLLACTLPFAWALAVRPGRSRQWHVAAALIGSVALGSQASALVSGGMSIHPLSDPRALTVLGMAVLAGARPAVGLRLEAGERGRWRVGVTVALAVLAGLEGDPRLLPVAIVLGATAAGLGLGLPEQVVRRAYTRGEGA